MLGLDPALGRGEFFRATLPGQARAADVDAVYVPSAPYGGDLPFRTDQGIANYYGVGAYRRPLADARAAGVRFAAECLAFANVPDEAVIEALLPGSPGAMAVHDPRWQAGVPRDVGAEWDFDDVRDHYLALLFEVDPGELRSVDPERYMELSRAVSGEVMAEVFGEWRRSASTCGGGLVLSLRDLVPGAGWGLIDHRGMPKVAYHHLRRALAPLAVWTTDEGLGGVIAHVANDGPSALSARLRVTLYQDLELRVGEGIEAIDIGGHGAHERNIETMVGHFVDAAWAYRFGPPAQDVIVASVERDGENGTELLSQSFRFPAGRPMTVESPAKLGLEGGSRTSADGTVRLAVRSRRLAYGVRIHAPGFSATDDAFSVEPGGTRHIDLHAAEPGTTFKGGTLTALNLAGSIAIAVGERPA
jgi:beta-mannosidase